MEGTSAAGPTTGLEGTDLAGPSSGGEGTSVACAGACSVEVGVADNEILRSFPVIPLFKRFSGYCFSVKNFVIPSTILSFQRSIAAWPGMCLVRNLRKFTSACALVIWYGGGVLKH